MANNSCPICNSQTNIICDPQKINCPRCGRFEIAQEALPMFEHSNLPDKILSVSYWIQNHQSDPERFVLINIELMRKLLIDFEAPKPKEQADKFILWLGNSMKKPNQKVGITATNLISILGAYDEFGVYYIVRYLHDEKFIDEDGIEKSSIIPRDYKFSMTFKGWNLYDELQRASKDSRLAFMAMKYNDETLEKIFDEVIKDAVSKTGFDIRKLEEEKRAGLIDDKLRVEIRRSKFLIADLTHDNNGAYWEAGFAEGLGMPVIYICEERKFEKEKSHFDTNHHLTVTWKDNEDGLKKFAMDLKATIRATFPAEAKIED